MVCSVGVLLDVVLVLGLYVVLCCVLIGLVWWVWVVGIVGERDGGLGAEGRLVWGGMIGGGGVWWGLGD